MGGNDDGGDVATQEVLRENEVERQREMGDVVAEQTENRVMEGGGGSNGTNRANLRT